MANRRWIWGVFGMLAGLGVVLFATTAPAPPTDEAVNTRTVTAPPDVVAVDVDDAGDDVDETTQRVLGELRSAIDALYARPVEISLEMNEEGRPVTAVLRVDREAGLLEGTSVAPLDNGAAITTRHVIVDQRVFFKSTTSPEAEAALDFTELPYATNGPKLFDEVYAGYARVKQDARSQSRSARERPIRCGNHRGGRRDRDLRDHEPA